MLKLVGALNRFRRVVADDDEIRGPRAHGRAQREGWWSKVSAVERKSAEPEPSSGNAGLCFWAHPQRRTDACSSTIQNQATISKQTTPPPVVANIPERQGC